MPRIIVYKSIKGWGDFDENEAKELVELMVYLLSNLANWFIQQDIEDNNMPNS